MHRPRRIDSSRPRPDPLEPAELDGLWRWQWRMYAFYGVAMALIVGAFLLIHWYRDVRELRWGAIVLVGALTAIGGLVQFRERCPRCAIRIGRHARLILPEKCPECGVAFPRRADVPAPH